jgi:hypothetical protein
MNSSTRNEDSHIQRTSIVSGVAVAVAGKTGTDLLGLSLWQTVILILLFVWTANFVADWMAKRKQTT